LHSTIESIIKVKRTTIPDHVIISIPNIIKTKLPKFIKKNLRTKIKDKYLKTGKPKKNLPKTSYAIKKIIKLSESSS